MTHNGFEYVDLELPSGTLWATTNVGANDQNGCGLYFRWGESIGHNLNEFRNRSFSYDSIDPKHFNMEDAANHNMGGNWRVPTFEDFIELKEHTNYMLIRNDKGRPISMVFESIANKKSLLFPFCGYTCHLIEYHNEPFGYYWSFTIKDGFRFYALSLFEDMSLMNFYEGHYGFQVRGVVNKNDL